MRKILHTLHAITIPTAFLPSKITEHQMKKFFARNKAKRETDRKRGMSLIELVLVIAAGIGLLIAVFLYYNQASASAEVQERVQQVTSIAAEIRSQYKTQASFAALATPAGVTSLQNASGLPASAWNGVTITGTTNNFRISIADIGRVACLRISESPQMAGHGASVVTGTGGTQCSPTTGTASLALTFLR